MCGMILSYDAGQWQPGGHEGKQWLLHSVLCCQRCLDVVFHVFAFHHIYKTPVCVSCSGEKKEKKAKFKIIGQL